MLALLLLVRLAVALWSVSQEAGVFVNLVQLSALVVLIRPLASSGSAWVYATRYRLGRGNGWQGALGGWRRQRRDRTWVLGRDCDTASQGATDVIVYGGAALILG